MDWYFKLDAFLMSQSLLRCRTQGFTELSSGFFGCMMDSRHKVGMGMLVLEIRDFPDGSTYSQLQNLGIFIASIRVFWFQKLDRCTSWRSVNIACNSKEIYFNLQLLVLQQKINCVVISGLIIQTKQVQGIHKGYRVYRLSYGWLW